MSFFYDQRLLLLRHGEAESNKRRAFLGRQDDPLTQKGREQAQHLASLLADEPIHQIISSPLQRAHDTAATVAAVKGLALNIDKALLEQDFGKWDGLTFEDVKQQYPQNFKDWWRDGLNKGPLEGENLNEVTQRLEDFYAGLSWEKGKTIALVGHGGAFQALLCSLLQIPTRGFWPFRLQTGSLTEIQFVRGQASLTRLSWTG